MMMIPLSDHRLPGGRPATVEVDNVEGTVYLSLRLDPREVYQRGPARSISGEVDEIIAGLDDGTRGPTLKKGEVLALVDEIRHLRARLTEVEIPVDVRPERDEARAIAGALIHFAGEAEAGRA